MPESFLPLKSNWFHILLSLAGGEQHGYGIMQDVLERSEGKVRLWPATLLRFVEEAYPGWPDHRIWGPSGAPSSMMPAAATTN